MSNAPGTHLKLTGVIDRDVRIGGSVNIKLETLAEILTANQEIKGLIGPDGDETIMDIKRRMAFILNDDRFVWELFRSLKKLHGACLVLSKVEIETKRIDLRER